MVVIINPDEIELTTVVTIALGAQGWSVIAQTVKRLTVLEHAAAESTQAPCESDKFLLSINDGKKMYGIEPPK